MTRARHDTQRNEELQHRALSAWRRVGDAVLARRFSVARWCTRAPHRVDAGQSTSTSDAWKGAHRHAALDHSDRLAFVCYLAAPWRTGPLGQAVMPILLRHVFAVPAMHQCRSTHVIRRKHCMLFASLSAANASKVMHCILRIDHSTKTSRRRSRADCQEGFRRPRNLEAGDCAYRRCCTESAVRCAV